jgi:hypothetical protein
MAVVVEVEAEEEEERTLGGRQPQWDTSYYKSKTKWKKEAHHIKRPIGDYWH